MFKIWGTGQVDNPELIKQIENLKTESSNWKASFEGKLVAEKEFNKKIDELQQQISSYQKQLSGLNQKLNENSYEIQKLNNTIRECSQIIDPAVQAEIDRMTSFGANWSNFCKEQDNPLSSSYKACKLMGF